MSRTHHVPLEQAETAVYGGASSGLARRRATLEAALAAAVAEGDRELVSRLRGELALLAGVMLRDAPAESVITAARRSDASRPCGGPGCARAAPPRGRYCGTSCRVRAHQLRRGCARCRGKLVVEPTAHA